MVVASQTWQLSLPGCASLKEKRSVVRSLKDRLRGRFQLSVAETGLQDVHGQAELSVALVAVGIHLSIFATPEINIVNGELSGSAVSRCR